MHLTADRAGTVITACPDCGRRDGAVMGQYQYYHTPMRLRECPGCGLIWADVHLDPAVIAAHFESAYKGREYFRVSRAAIFDALARTVARAAPFGGRVLDVGGAQGDLLHRIASLRPDLRLVLHDLSEEATRFAAREYGLDCLNGNITSLSEADGTFDAVILSDVLYYEPQLRRAWPTLKGLVAPGGLLLLRVPNKVALIRLGLWYQGLRARLTGRPPGDVPFFNPEHIYILTRGYLEDRLARSGFGAVRSGPTPPLNHRGTRAGAIIGTLIQLVASAFCWLTRGRTIVTPGMVVVARRETPVAGVHELREMPVSHRPPPGKLMSSRSILSLSAVLAVVGCSATDPSREPGIGVIHPGLNGIPVIEAPDTVSRNQSFAIVVNTFGSGCVQPTGVSLRLDPDAAHITPYDLDPTATEPCTKDYRARPHPVELVLREAGRARITVRGYSAGGTVPGRNLVTVEKEVWVRP